MHFEIEHPTAQMYFGCVIEVLLDSLSSVPVVLGNLSLQAWNGIFAEASMNIHLSLDFVGSNYP